MAVSQVNELKMSSREISQIHGGADMGKTLIEQISVSTGLPENLIQDELVTLLASAGVNPDLATLEDLRKVLADYLQDVLVAAKEDLAS